jgi:hypothetical protein
LRCAVSNEGQQQSGACRHSATPRSSRMGSSVRRTSGPADILFDGRSWHTSTLRDTPPGHTVRVFEPADSRSDAAISGKSAAPVAYWRTLRCPPDFGLRDRRSRLRSVLVLLAMFMLARTPSKRSPMGPCPLSLCMFTAIMTVWTGQSFFRPGSRVKASLPSRHPANPDDEPVYEVARH